MLQVRVSWTQMRSTKGSSSPLKFRKVQLIKQVYVCTYVCAYKVCNKRQLSFAYISGYYFQEPFSSPHTSWAKFERSFPSAGRMESALSDNPVRLLETIHCR